MNPFLDLEELGKMESNGNETGIGGPDTTEHGHLTTGT